MTLTSTQANPHLRIRRDHANETAEDYVEAIAAIIDKSGSCRCVDLAKCFGVSHVTVSRIVSRLQNKGLISTEPYHPILLTLKGKRLATECIERHNIVYRFLLAIGVDEQIATIDAEGIEHHVSRTTLQRFLEWTN